VPRVKHGALPAQYEQTAWLRLELADPGSDARFCLTRSHAALPPAPPCFPHRWIRPPAASRARRLAWSLWVSSAWRRVVTPTEEALASSWALQRG